MTTPDSTLVAPLMEAAKKAASNAYCPSSEYSVGSAVLSVAGNIYSGCNVENASFGATQCAERNAINSGITAEGPLFKIKLILVVEIKEGDISPCGICRQVIFEFADEDTLVGYGEAKSLKWRSIQTLLPDGFKHKK